MSFAISLRFKFIYIGDQLSRITISKFADHVDFAFLLLLRYLLIARRIRLICGIIVDVCVEIHVRGISDWICLQEPPQLRGVVTSAVVVQEYGENIPERHLIFFTGNMAKRQWQFIVIGLLRSGLDPTRACKASFVATRMTTTPL
jgi:hypothetical protein